MFSGPAAAEGSKIFTRLIRKKLFTFGNEGRKWNSEFDARQAGGGGGVKARLMEEAVTRRSSNWVALRASRKRRKGQEREGQLQVHCTNVGRQGQSRERLLLVSPSRLSPGLILLQLSSSCVFVGYQTVHILPAERWRKRSGNKGRVHFLVYVFWKFGNAV